MAIVNIPGFNGGEVSPNMYSRVDNNAYPMSCKRLINFIPLQTGPAKRRSGFVLVNKAGSDDKPVRLIPFVFSTGQSYCLEFGEFYMRIHRNGGTVLNPNGTIYEVPTEIPANVAIEMQFAQSADVVILVHSSMPPYQIGRYAELDWRITKMSFVPPLILTEPPETSYTGTAGSQIFEYAVTAVLQGGMETAIGPSDFVENVPLSLTFENYVTVIHPPVTEQPVEYLKVYRRRNGFWGYVGRAIQNEENVTWVDSTRLSDGRTLIVGNTAVDKGYWIIRSADGTTTAMKQMPIAASCVATFGLKSGSSKANVIAFGKNQQNPKLMNNQMWCWCVWNATTEEWGPMVQYAMGSDANYNAGFTTCCTMSSGHVMAAGRAGTARGRLSVFSKDTEAQDGNLFPPGSSQYDIQGGMNYLTKIVNNPGEGTTGGAVFAFGQYGYFNIYNPVTRAWGTKAQIREGRVEEIHDAAYSQYGSLYAITHEYNLFGRRGVVFEYERVSSPGGSGGPGYIWRVDLSNAFGHPFVTCSYSSVSGLVIGTSTGRIYAGHTWALKYTPPPGEIISWQGSITQNNNVVLMLGNSLRIMDITDNPQAQKITTGYTFIDDGTYGPDVSHGPPVYENDFTVDFPRTVTYHDNRLIFGGTASQPNTLYGSELGIFNSFATFQTPTAATPFIFQLRSDQINTIQWMRSVGGRLQVGTSGGEWALRNLRADQVWEGGRSSQVGSKYLEALALDSGTLYVDRIGKTVRTFLYEVQRGDFVSYDLTIYADHLLDERAIIAWTYATTPYAQVWCVCDDGIALCMTYNNAQGVIAWGRMITDGKIKGICAIPTTDEDEVYIVVERGGKQYVEVMAKDFRGDVQSMVFLDAAVRYDLEEPATEFDGLEHLEGREISICADGATMPPQTVVDGKITLPHPATRVVAGLPYVSTLETTEIEGGSNSVSQSRQRRIGMITTKLIESVGGKIGVGTNDMNVDADSSLRLEPIRYTEQPARNSTMPMSRPARLFTGHMEITPESGHSNSPSIVIEQDAPQPLTVAAFYPRMDEHGR